MTSPTRSLRTGGVSDCPKPMGEREGAEALSRYNRPWRQVENPPGFQADESRPIWPIWKTGEIASCTAGTGRFLRRKTPISQSKNRFLEIFACAVKRRERKLERAAGDAKSTGFCGSLSKNLPAGNAMQSLWRNCKNAQKRICHCRGYGPQTTFPMTKGRQFRKKPKAFRQVALPEKAVLLLLDSLRRIHRFLRFHPRGNCTAQH